VTAYIPALYTIAMHFVAYSFLYFLIYPTALFILVGWFLFTRSLTFGSHGSGNGSYFEPCMVLCSGFI